MQFFQYMAHILCNIHYLCSRLQASLPLTGVKNKIWWCKSLFRDFSKGNGGLPLSGVHLLFIYQ